MPGCHSAVAKTRALPAIWLVTDARNDERLEHTLRRLPRGSGLIFRHYHLEDKDRDARFASLARAARRRGHLVALAGTAGEARRQQAGAAYGAARSLHAGPAMMRLVTVHSLREIARAQRIRADAIVLSPVFATRSHLEAVLLGPIRFRLLARHACVPVIALGGMTERHARRLRWRRWAAIDGL